MSESTPRPNRSSPMAEEPFAAPSTKPSIVRIVGTGEGIVRLIGDRGGRWSDIVRILSDHLARAEGFFQGERVAVDIGERSLSADDLQQIADVLAGYNVTIWAVRTSNPHTHRMVQEIGLAAEWLDKPKEDRPPSANKGERAQWEVHLGRKGQPAPIAKPVAEFQPPQIIADSIADQALDPEGGAVERRSAAVAESVAETKRTAIPPALTPPPEESEDEVTDQEMILAPPYIYRGTLRSGQVFRHAGTVMVVGDVNPGAEVISGGDIFVWGKLRGIVHAGAMGNERAVVCAIDFEPIQLRIAGYIAMSPKTVTSEPGRWFWKKDAVEKPEVARVMGRQIVVDVWDRE
ncbi:MAG: hypothetical protein HY328_12175 [Chloroflexi bacterium]|nr:hypothetical protein [Chloroflexota bacterium]